ncbi:aldo/keto reductase [Pseudonocardia lacus]|uniref:aldo/keto reductase n=1 Tax=Pseudonocardia lacus TaxID=2835865 RepID=UPI0027E31A59|nr:aldo/keto reductase [Pseudonocardia lacus]
MAEIAPGSLGLGGANLGNLFAPMTDDEATALLGAAWDSGIRYFDTAPHYGLGLSERRLGRFLATRPRDEYVVSTKAGRLLEPSPATAGERDADLYDVPADVRRVWDFSADGVRRSLTESLERLGLDRVDVLFLHDPEVAGLDDALATGVPAAVALREEGLVDAVGVGSTSTEALVAAARAGGLDLLMVAGRFTLLEQPAAAELLPECRARGIGVVAAGVLNSGLLASPRPGDGARYEYQPVPADVLARARRLADVCDGYGVELPVAALRFPWREETVRSVVLGAGSAAELRETVRRARTPVPDALWAALAAQGMVAA